MKIVIGDDGPAMEVEDLDGIRVLARRLDALADEKGMDAEDILTQVEEANGLNPVGWAFAARLVDCSEGRGRRTNSQGIQAVLVPEGEREEP